MVPKPVCASVLARMRFAVREVEPRTGARQLRRGLVQLDLVGRWVDHEQQITFMDDVAVLEADLRKRAADLCAQLDLIDGRELTQKLKPRVDLPPKRRADGDARQRSGRGLPRREARAGVARQ